MDKLKEASPPPELSPVVAWFLRGDKYLHEDSLNNRKELWTVGALLYVCVFVINEFIWRFMPFTGMRTAKILLGYPMFFSLCAYVVVLITRRILFGANTMRPNPARGMPNRTAPRLDYQNVIPPYGENKWLTKRLAAYADLQCCMILDVFIAWYLAIVFSMPYYLFQEI